MAKSTIPLLFFCSIVLLASAHPNPKRPATFSFYLHDTLQNGSHPWTNTAAEVAGPNHNLTGIGFGRVIVFNDRLTSTPSLDELDRSNWLGKGQGMYIYDHIETGVAFNALLVFSALVETPQLNGTLNFVGADTAFLASRDISVVGGTGDFELARGIATITTHSVDGDTFIIRFSSRLVYS